MHTRILRPKHGPTLVAKPLRHGDVRTVIGLFGRFGKRSRRARFNGPKPCLKTSAKAPGDRISFNVVPSAAAGCLPNGRRAATFTRGCGPETMLA